jgi:hypothetical protein
VAAVGVAAVAVALAAEVNPIVQGKETVGWVVTGIEIG